MPSRSCGRGCAAGWNGSALTLAFTLGLGITLAGCLVLPGIAREFGGRLSEILHGIPIGSFLQPISPTESVGNALAVWYMALLFVAASSGPNVLPLAFSIEREKATLDFLLVTPLSSPAIVFGKAVGLLLSEGMILLAMEAWTLLLALGLSLWMVSPRPLIAWVVVTLVMLALCLLSGMVALAVSSLFPRLIARGLRVFLQVILTYSFLLFPVIASVSWTPMQYFLSQHSFALWLIYIVGCPALTALAALVAVWGVQRMRRGDIAFGQTKREN